jgi:hypothetical protein
LDFLQDWDERGCPGNTVFETIISITAPHLCKIVNAGGISRANITIRMKKTLFKYIPFLCHNDGNYNLNGLLFTSIIFGFLFFSLSKTMKQVNSAF